MTHPGFEPVSWTSRLFPYVHPGIRVFSWMNCHFFPVHPGLGPFFWMSFIKKNINDFNFFFTVLKKVVVF
jgi:hypothetical protein